MIGLELVAGYLAAYAFRKARHAGKRVDIEVDYALDETLDRLHEVISEKLGDDPAVRKLRCEAEAGDATPRTAQRVTLAVEDAAEADDEFAERLRGLLRELASLEGSGPARSVVRQTATASHGSTVNQAGRDIVQSSALPRNER
jgi:hypothetical protein